MKKIISQGAEAILLKKGNIVQKKRIKKSYRLKELDEKIRKSRTRKESKLLEKTSKLIPAPRIIKIDEKNKEIQMEFIPGSKLSESLESLNYKQICKTIGKQIALLHDSNIIHGDLTTSNMILSPDNILYFIDFGLGYESNKIEDRAVDLHLIKEALEAKHFSIFNACFNAVKEGYKISRYSKETLKRLEAVEKRGRYKQQY